jgi:hypothetical protein
VAALLSIAMATRPPFAAIVFPPANDLLPAFPLATRRRGKTRFPGGVRRRWKDPDGTIYEWDYQHGTVEMYDRRGRPHRGEFDPRTGAQIGPPDPRRSVEP